MNTHGTPKAVRAEFSPTDDVRTFGDALPYWFPSTISFFPCATDSHVSNPASLLQGDSCDHLVRCTKCLQ